MSEQANGNTCTGGFRFTASNCRLPDLRFTTRFATILLLAFPTRCNPESERRETRRVRFTSGSLLLAVGGPGVLRHLYMHMRKRYDTLHNGMA